jgi:4-hydroxy-4-methyl-2-oxoglutarate aldolase
MNEQLATPLIADACLRLKIPLRIAPVGLRAVNPSHRINGRVLPAKHFGSVDVFLEAMHSSQPGDVLVIDNSGRTDEGCIGDLTVLEARAWKLAGFVVWGLHRDTAELVKIDFPVFSYGTCPAGPVRLDRRTEDALQFADFGPHVVGSDDHVFADEDGAIFVPRARLAEILQAAQKIYDTERKQADRIRAGEKLSEQLQFEDYLKQRAKDPAYTLRQHLRKIGGAIEE